MDVPSWIMTIMTAIMAASTVAIGWFAWTQVRLERQRQEHERTAARDRAMGPAWLLRRTLEQALRAAYSYKAIGRWAEEVGHGHSLDRLEGQALELLRLGALAGGQAQKDSATVFQAFLAYADCVNPLVTMADKRQAPRPGDGSRTDEDRARMAELGEQALRHLHAVIKAAEHFAPRREHEPELPKGHPRILAPANGS